METKRTTDLQVAEPEKIIRQVINIGARFMVGSVIVGTLICLRKKKKIPPAYLPIGITGGLLTILL